MATTPNLPTFDIHEIPFSRRGSWLNLSPVTGLHRTAEDIHLISHITGMHAIVRLELTRDGQKVPTTNQASPASLTWLTEGHSLASAVFESTTAIRIIGTDANLTISDAADALTPFTGVYFFREPLDGSLVFTSYETGRRYRLTVLRGEAAVTGVEALGEHRRAVTISGTEGWDVLIDEYEAGAPVLPPAGSFTESVQAVADEFAHYLDAIAGWRTADTPAVPLAAYVLWSATVSPSGFLHRESILMSKHWMDKVWSWDHTFNALAVAPGFTELAIDQYLTPFDHQDGSGAMPDSVTHSEVLYNFVKPPIHGWALRKLRERTVRPLTIDELGTIYTHLARWTRFWLDYRTAPGRDLPYYQHGNDSGWDNSTTFDHDRVIESPDLASLLALQLDVLADLADELGKNDVEWRIERDRIETALLEQLHDDEGFFAVSPLSGRRSKRSSLLNHLPVLAADRYPASVTAGLAQSIQGHLTEWGPATQLPDTEEYESDGYWRGPIWAPSTMLIEEGLRRTGHEELADTVNARFRRLCEESGFAENFDALTGEGLRDRAYTWTASVYLIFSHEWVRRVVDRHSDE